MSNENGKTISNASEIKKWRDVDLTSLSMEDLTLQHGLIENEIFRRIAKLPNHGKDCDCEEPDEFIEIDDGMALSHCLKCGGYVPW